MSEDHPKCIHELDRNFFVNPKLGHAGPKFLNGGGDHDADLVIHTPDGKTKKKALCLTHYAQIRTITSQTNISVLRNGPDMIRKFLDAGIQPLNKETENWLAILDVMGS